MHSKGNSNFFADKARQVISLRFISLAIPCLVLIVLFDYFLGFNLAAIANNIDGSWQYTLSNLRHTSQTLGVNVFYNFGPLLERIASYISVRDSLKDFLIANLYFLTALLANLYVLFRFLKSSLTSKPYQLWAIVSSIYLLFAVNNIDALFYIMLIVTILAVRKEKSLSIKLFMLAAIQLLSLYKFSFSLATFIMSPLVFLESFKPAELMSALRNWFCSIGVYFVVYTGVTLTLSVGFFKYFYYGTVDAIYYNQFFGLPFSYHRTTTLLFVFMWTILFACCAYYVIRDGIIKRKNIFDSNLIMGLVIITLASFFVLKESVVRNDGHLLSFTPLFPILLLPISLAWERSLHKKKVSELGPLFAVSLVTGGFLLLSVQWAFLQVLSNPIATYGSRMGALSKSLIDNKLNYSFFNTQVKWTKILISPRYSEVASINKSLNVLAPHQQVIVFGNSTLLSTLLSSSHQVLQSPFLQNYDAVPPSLFDPLYTDFLKQHPNDVVFLEETEASINQRVPAYQFNDTYQYIFHNYRLIAADTDHTQYLLKRATNDMPTCSKLAPLTLRESVPEKLPHYTLEPGQYIEMKATLPSSLAEDGLSLLIKKPLYSIALNSTGGGVATFRIEQNTLGHGIVLDPLYLSYRDFHNNTPFLLSAFTINGGVNKQGLVRTTMYKCSY